MRYSRYEKARKISLFWCLFIGLGAVAGSIGMLTALDGSNLGMQELIVYFQVLPFSDILFQDFLFPGIALLCVNGIPNLIASGLILAKKKSGVVFGMIFGFTLMAWIIIQFIIFPMNFMSTIYFIFGICQAITGVAGVIFYEQEQFQSSEEKYEGIGNNKTRLVVYFSRMGYVKKLAYSIAQRSGAELYEIKSTERVEGTLGFWWCGRYGMHRWEMPIEPVSIDFEKYEAVTICSPIWVFHLAAPVRTFCHYAEGRIKKADYVLVHFQRCGYENAAEEMDALLNVKAEHVISYCSRKGKIINKKNLR